MRLEPNCYERNSSNFFQFGSLRATENMISTVLGSPLDSTAVFCASTAILEPAENDHAAVEVATS